MEKIHVLQIKLTDSTYQLFKKMKGKKPWTDFVQDLVYPKLKKE